MLPAEEEVLEAVLDLLEALFANPKVRHMLWTQEKPLMSFCWDWALMGPPPPDGNYACAYSSHALQLRVGHLVATTMHDATLLLDPAWRGLERLLVVCCTGGRGGTVTEKMQVSQAAVAILRACLLSTNDKHNELVQELVLAALAPPPEEGLPMMDPMADAEKRIVLPKLLQTVSENLHGVTLAIARSNGNEEDDDRDTATTVPPLQDALP